jgi:hypothetical protein
MVAKTKITIVDNEPYTVHIDAWNGAPCGCCDNKIKQHEKATAIVHSTSFFYYHPECWFKSYEYAMYHKLHDIKLTQDECNTLISYLARMDKEHGGVPKQIQSIAKKVMLKKN